MSEALLIKIPERRNTFFAFFLMVQVNGTSLMNALFGEEFAPIGSLVERAGVRDGPPVKTPTSNLRLERGTGIALSRFDTAARVDEPADIFLFHKGPSQKKFG